jgi:hypothetical protein
VKLTLIFNCTLKLLAPFTQPMWLGFSDNLDEKLVKCPLYSQWDMENIKIPLNLLYLLKI